MTLPAKVKSIENAMMHKALAETNGNKKDAARKLGINRTTLVEKLKAMEVQNFDVPQEVYIPGDAKVDIEVAETKWGKITRISIRV